MADERDQNNGVETELEPHSIDLHEMSARAFRRDILQDARRISPSEERRFGKPQTFRFFWRSPLVMLAAGIPGLIIFIGSFQTAELLDGLGISLTDANGNNWTGLLRLVITIVGLVLLAVAAPTYRLADWIQTEEDKLEQDHQHFQNKQFGSRKK